MWAWCLCAVLVESRNMAKAPTSIGGHGPAIEPLTLGPLTLPAVSRPFRNLAARGSLRFGTDGMFTIIVRRLPSRRSQVETGYIRIAEPRPVRNCAFSDLTVGFMAAGHRLSGQVSRPWTVFGVEEAGCHAVETPRLLQDVLQNGVSPQGLRLSVGPGSKSEQRYDANREHTPSDSMRSRSQSTIIHVQSMLRCQSRAPKKTWPVCAKSMPLLGASR